ncbi:hypothetical protein EV1_018705 [Malus domestica]
MKKTARLSLNRGDISSTTAYSGKKPVNISMLYCLICQFLDDHVPIHPWYLDLGLRFPILNFTKEVMVVYNLILCNLKPPSYWIITSFELLNEWYRVELGIQKICKLYTIQQSSKCRYFFEARASLQWQTYITNLPKQDKDWYTDILVIEGEWEGKIIEVRVPHIPTRTW